MKHPALLITGSLLLGLAACGGSAAPSLFNNSNQAALIEYADGSQHQVEPQRTLQVPSGAKLVVPKRLACTYHYGDGEYDSPKTAEPQSTVRIDQYVFLEECLVQH